MNTNDIVLAIDAEIAQLQRVKALLTDTDVTTKRKPGRPAGVGRPKKASSLNSVQRAKEPKRRTMSAEGRAKIAEAQKVRWAKVKKTTKDLARKTSSSPAKKVVTTKTAARKTSRVMKDPIVKKSAQPEPTTAASPAS
jgi:phage terminase small subunit